MNTLYAGLPNWLSGKESTCNAGNTGSIPGFGRSPGIGNGSLTLVFLPGKIPWTEGTWQATVHRVAKSQTRLSDLAHTHNMLSPMSLSNKPPNLGVLPGTSDTH